eukprot:766475-Hanusia_phi.AAC.4
MYLRFFLGLSIATAHSPFIVPSNKACGVAWHDAKASPDFTATDHSALLNSQLQTSFYPLIVLNPPDACSRASSSSSEKVVFLCQIVGTAESTAPSLSSRLFFHNAITSCSMLRGQLSIPISLHARFSAVSDTSCLPPLLQHTHKTSQKVAHQQPGSIGLAVAEERLDHVAGEGDGRLLAAGEHLGAGAAGSDASDFRLGGHRRIHGGREGTEAGTGTGAGTGAVEVMERRRQQIGIQAGKTDYLI